MRVRFSFLQFFFNQQGKFLRWNGAGEIIALNELAAGVLLQLHRRGIKVPEEIRVSGLGDTKLARAFAGEMSTIRYEYEESGRIAAGLLMEMLGGASVSADHKAGYTIVE